MYGSRGGQGVIVGVDFSSLHEPQCRNPENPGSKNSDYEIWTPHDSRYNSRCILGQYSEYVRRKRESECFNGEQFERQTFVEICECTSEDYECDYGFYKNNSG